MIGKLDASVLTLFGIEAGKAAMARAAMKYTDASPASEIAPQGGTAEEQAFAAKADAFQEGIMNGTVSPIGELAREFSGSRAVARMEASGMMFEGYFIMASADGEVGMANFATRQDAMINAYHYARAAAHGVTKLISFQANESSEVFYGSSYAIVGANTERDARQPASMLALQFGFEDALVTTTGEGRPAFAGLTVTHATYGKMLTIGADGTVTLYDRSGKGYTEADYNAAQPDSVIPELWNMINGKTDRLNIYV